MKIALLVLTLFLLFSVTAISIKAQTTARVYYMSTSGSDSNSGTASSPFKTWTKFASVARPGDTIYLKAGNYTSSNFPSIKFTLSGTSSAWIKVSAAPGDEGRATINGALTFYNKYMEFSNLDFNASSDYRTMNFYDAHYLTFKNNKIHGARLYGCIHIAGEDIADHITFINNKIYDCSYGGGTGSAMGLTGGRDLLFKGNEVYNAYEGFQIKGGALNITVEDNTFHDITTGNAIFGASGETLSGKWHGDPIIHDPNLPVSERYNAKNVIVRNNIIYNHKGTYAIAPRGWRDFTVTHNTIYNHTGTYAVYVGSMTWDFLDSTAINYCSSNSCSACTNYSGTATCKKITLYTKNGEIKNNVVRNFNKALKIDSGNTTGVTIGNNTYYKSGLTTTSSGVFTVTGSSYSLSGAQSRGYETNTIIADPLFVSVGTGVPNLNIRSDSPLVNKGVGTSTPTVYDILDNLRDAKPDIGAYEVNGANPPSNNQAPNGTITSPTQLTASVGQSVSFTSTGADPDNNLPLTYLWNFGDINGTGTVVTSSSQNSTVTFGKDGIYNISLTVKDALGLADATPATATVTVGNAGATGGIKSPVAGSTLSGIANVVVDYTINSVFNPATSTYLYLDNSTAPLTSCVGSFQCTYSWDTTRVANGSHTLKSQLNLLFGQPVISTVTISVSNTEPGGGTGGGTTQPPATNQRPNGTIISPATYQNNISIGASVIFVGKANDPDNNLPFVYNWNFGDINGTGTSVTSTAQNPTITYTREGTYTAFLTVADGLGLSDSPPASVRITVGNAGATGGINLPVNGSIVSGNVTVSANFAINSIFNPATSTYLYLDNSTAPLTSCLGSFQCNYSWNTTQIANGTHTLKAQLNLLLGAPAISNVTVSVNNTQPSGGTQPGNALYIAPNGNDSTGNGSETNPYKTLKRAITQAANNTNNTIYFKEGTYAITASPDNRADYNINQFKPTTTCNSLTNSNMLTVTVDPRAVGDVVLSMQGNFTSANSSIFKLYNSKCVHVDGKNKMIFDGATATLAPFKALVEIGAYQDQVQNILWENTTVRNALADPDARGIAFLQDQYKDAQGNTIPSNIIIRGNQVYNISGRALGGFANNLYIENNNVYNAALRNRNNAMCNASSCSGWPGVVQTYVNFATNDIAKNVYIRNNTVHESWGEGILSNYVDNLEVTGNNVYDVYSVGIYFGAVKNVKIVGNRVARLTSTFDRFNSSGTLRRIHGISIAHESADPAFIPTENVLIANNLFLNTKSGINYFYESGSYKSGSTYKNLRIINNVFKGMTDYPLSFSQAPVAPTGAVAQNNIIYKGGFGNYNLGDSGAWTFNNNTWVDGIPTDRTHANSISCVGNTTNCPGFVATGDSDVNNFKLATASVNINAGVPTEVTGDYFGNVRDSRPDIGIFELSGGSTTQPPVTNQAPNGVIISPSSQTVSIGQSMQFMGGGSDPDGNYPLSYVWYFGDINGTGTAVTSTAQNPSVSFTKAGTYNVTFTVKDSLGLVDSTPATVTMTVGNAGATGGITSPVNSATVSGTVSVVADFTISSIFNPATSTYLYLDNSTAPLTSCLGSFQCNYSWNTTQIANGTHTLKAQLNLLFGAPVVSTVTVTVANNVASTPFGFGIVSDSSSDEYRADDNRAGGTQYAATTLSWDELLVKYRRANLGPWGTRLEPRRTGYEYNWARTGAQAHDIVISGAATGAAQQVASGNYKVVYFNIGTNDFAYYRDGAKIYNGTISGQALTDKINNIIKDISNSVRTITSASPNVKVLLGTVGDMGSLPNWQAQFPDATKRQLVTNAINTTNNGIISMATTTPQIILFDTKSFERDIFSKVNSSGNLVVGGQNITFTSTGDEPHHAILSDGIHAGTVINGYIANTILRALNSAGSTTVPEFTDNEMLQFAGIIGSVTSPPPPPTQPQVNLAPNGVIVSPTSAPILVGQSINFVANGTDQDNNLPLSYLWNFGDVEGRGSALTSTSQNTTVFFTREGTFSISMTVKDSLGAMDPTPASLMLTVGNPAATGGLIAPVNGAVVSGTVNVTADFTLNNIFNPALATYIYIDNNTAPVKTCLGSFSCTLNWDTNNVINGNHTLKAELTRMFSTPTVSVIQVSVQNSTTVPDDSINIMHIKSPLNNDIITGTANYLADFSDLSSIISVILKVDGIDVKRCNLTNVCQTILDSATLTVGEHKLTAVGVDVFLAQTTHTITVQVGSDKNPPTGSILSPANNATVSGSIVISTEFLDIESGLSSVRLLIDNAEAKVCNNFLQPINVLYRCDYSWLTPLVEGTHTITAIAKDLANNEVTKTVTVFTHGGTTQPPVGGGTAPTVGANSYAMGLWSPSTRDTCTKDEHDSYFVIGPDGKKYPTWHPPVHRRANGTTCTFGHEHGRDPKGYTYWNEIKTHFAFDADGNGQISSTELATAGIPFNYSNEQIDTGGMTFMRHEDHVGNKIEYANGEADRGESNGDGFNSSATGGVVVPIKGTSTKWVDSGIKCYYFHKLHQGVSSPDALTNNIHEFVIHAKCVSTRTGYPTNTTLVTGLIPFGAPGEFTEFCNDDRDNIIRLGTTSTNSSFPGSTNSGFRNIISRACLERTFWVPQGQFSSFPYEDWDGNLRIKTSSGKLLVDQHGAWDVLDAIRYYDPNSSNKISFMTDACYFTEANGDKARGGECDSMTNYGALRLSYDDPRAFNGTHRGQYINPPTTVNNVGGPTIWYSDPFGNNAQTTPFKGSIKQYIDPVSASTANLNTDPRNIQRRHDDGGRTVHWPN